MKTPRIVKSVGHIDDDLINDAVKSEKSSKKNVWIKWTSLAACFAVVLIVAVVAGPIMSGNRNIAPSVDSGNINPVINNSDTNTSSNIEETSAQANTEEPDISVNNEENTPSESDNETSSPVHNEETKPAVNDETTNLVTNNEFGYESRYFYKVDDGDFSSYIGGKVINKDMLSEKISDVTVTAGWETWIGENLTETVTTETLRTEIYSIDGVSNDVAVALKFIDKGEAVTTTHYYVILNPDADLSAVKDYIIPYSVPGYTSYKTDGEETVVNENAEEITVRHTNPSVAE